MNENIKIKNQYRVLDDALVWIEVNIVLFFTASGECNATALLRQNGETSFCKVLHFTDISMKQHTYKKLVVTLFSGSYQQTKSVFLNYYFFSVFIHTTPNQCINAAKYVKQFSLFYGIFVVINVFDTTFVTLKREDVKSLIAVVLWDIELIIFPLEYIVIKSNRQGMQNSKQSN